MKKSIKVLSVTSVALAVGMGGWLVTKEPEQQKTLPTEKEFVIKADILPASIEKVDDSTRPEALATVYKASIENKYTDENGDTHVTEIDEPLKEETLIESYPMPSTTKKQREPEMIELLQNLVSRTDGSTNEVKDFTYRIVDEPSFLKWEKLFAGWVSGELTEAELKKKWTKIDEAVVPETGLTKPTVMTYEFAYSESAVEMMDGVLEEIEKNGGSTAPHIAFIDVFFDKEDSQYTLYYVESHIE
jgi:hypothetical protein